jgi:hypothetical protein
MGDLADLSAATIVGKPGAVCASPEALYVATRHYRSQVQDWYFEESDVHEATSIDKFALQPESTFVRYVGSGVAKGRVLNQFSMDEYRGNLRIATTTGRVPDPDVHSTVTVLTEQDGRLVRVGMVDGIAPTEDIRSVRYDRDVGYVVTFEKTDPLFVLDLSHPEQPTLRGELHIPGYSTYLHLMDEVHLLTMGYGAEDQGDFAWFSGLQLQVINVADLDAPILLHRETIGTRGSTSDAATNHLRRGCGGELWDRDDIQRTARLSGHGRRRLRAPRWRSAPHRRRLGRLYAQLLQLVDGVGLQGQAQHLHGKLRLLGGPRPDSSLAA